MHLQIFSKVLLQEKLDNEEQLFSHCISINDPGSFPLRDPYSFFIRTLRLEFEDVSFNANRGSGKVLPTENTIKEIVGFYNDTKDEADGYTVHCHAGISRSPAAGLMLLYLDTKSEEQAFSRLLEIKDFCLPNKIMIDIFDGLYGTKLGEYNYRLWKLYYSTVSGRPIDEIWDGV
jgi:predicted protein tyrosine phosphatase